MQCVMLVPGNILFPIDIHEHVNDRRAAVCTSGF